MQLDPHELGLLLSGLFLEQGEIRAQIHLPGVHDDLDREIKRIEEALEAKRDRVLLLGRLEPEIY